MLEAELSELGFTDVYTDELRYVYGRLPAAKGYEEKPCIGFIAHMDTVADFCDRDIRPCPNLGTGGYGFHGPYEHISAEGMDRCVDVIIGEAVRRVIFAVCVIQYVLLYKCSPFNYFETETPHLPSNNIERERRERNGGAGEKSKTEESGCLCYFFR